MRETPIRWPIPKVTAAADPPARNILNAPHHDAPMGRRGHQAPDKGERAGAQHRAEDEGLPACVGEVRKYGDQRPSNERKK